MVVYIVQYIPEWSGGKGRVVGVYRNKENASYQCMILNEDARADGHETDPYFMDDYEVIE